MFKFWTISSAVRFRKFNTTPDRCSITITHIIDRNAMKTIAEIENRNTSPNFDRILDEISIGVIAVGRRGKMQCIEFNGNGIELINVLSTISIDMLSVISSTSSISISVINC